jgi:hypothetical protein
MWHPLPTDKQFWICNKSGQECMGAHILEKHPEQILGNDMEA